MLSESLEMLVRTWAGFPFDLMDVLKPLLAVPMPPISMSLGVLENWSYVRRALLGNADPERMPLEAPLLLREPRLKILRKRGRSVERQPTHMPTAISP